MNRSLYIWKKALPAALLIAVSTLAYPASRWMLGPFKRPENGNPVILPNANAVFQGSLRQAPTHWEALHTFNPAAVVRDGHIYVLYRAEDNTGQMHIGGHTSRLGMAISDDGVHFKQEPSPVFFPARDSQMAREWPGGVEDPRLVESDDGTYVLAYTQYNDKSYDVGIATSRDLAHWKKFGPAFLDASGGKYAHLNYKSAGIVTTLKDGRLIATKIDGKYWMYWGEKAMHLATSTDLIHWSPVENSHGVPIIVLSKRPGHFDSAFPEMGPPPVLTKKGIIVIYNGKNASEHGDASLPAGTYSNGQALFAANNPEKLIARTDRPFFKPEMAYERTGQYKEGTTFAEGLAFFKGKWFLYYGCADSFVGVAIAPAKANIGSK